MSKKVRISKRYTALLAALFSLAGITVSSSVTAVGAEHSKVQSKASQIDAVAGHRAPVQQHKSLSPAQPVIHDPVRGTSDTVINDESSVSMHADQGAHDLSLSSSKNQRRVLIQPLLNGHGEVLDHVTQVDVAVDEIKTVSGYGKRQKIVSAIQKIVPSGWSGFSSDDGIKEKMRVSWNAKNVPWTEVLNSVLAQSNLRALINWEKKEVDIMAFVETSNNTNSQQKYAPSQSVESAEKSSASVQYSYENGREDKVVTAPAHAKLSQSTQGQSKNHVQIKSAKVVEQKMVMASDLTGAKRSSASPARLQASGMVKGVSENRRTGAFVVTQSSGHLESEPRVAMLKDLEVEARLASMAASEAEALANEVAKAELAEANSAIIQAQNNKPTSSTYLSQVNSQQSSTVDRFRRIKIEGVSTTKAVLVQGSGFNIPLFTALAEVSPKGWLIYSKEGNFTSKMMTAWKGSNRPWLEVVDEMLAANNLTAVVRHNSREIQVLSAN